MNTTLFDEDGLSQDDVLRDIRHRVDDWRGSRLGPTLTRSFPAA